MLAMSHRLLSLGADFHLYYCTRAQAETAFYDEVKSLLGDKVTFVHDGGDPSKGLNLKETFGTPSPGTHLYVCGPGGFTTAVEETARRWGADAEQIHSEAFAF